MKYHELLAAQARQNIFFESKMCHERAKKTSAEIQERDSEGDRERERNGDRHREGVSQRESKFGQKGWGNAIFYASSVTDKKQRLHQLKESPNRAFN